jgi:uroporphyrinogen-III synthase
MIKDNNYDIIAFTSPSQVRNFMKIFRSTINYQLSTKFACIGKTTEKEILKYGIKPLIVSPKSDGINFAKEIEKQLIINNE